MTAVNVAKESAELEKERELDLLREGIEKVRSGRSIQGNLIKRPSQCYKYFLVLHTGGTHNDCLCVIIGNFYYYFENVLTIYYHVYNIFG